MAKLKSLKSSMQEIEEIRNRWINELKIKGYREEDFAYNLRREFSVGNENFTMVAELALRIGGENFIILKFERPTRFITPLERRTISIARIIDEKPFPFAILTNGVDCVFLNAIDCGEVEWKEVPERDKAENILRNLKIKHLTKEVVEKEMRIFAAIDSIRCEICEQDYSTCEQDYS